MKFRTKSKLKFFFKKTFGVYPYPYQKFSDKYKCIFIHIPKNAGTSIITLLNNNKRIEQEHNSYWDYLRSDPYRFSHYTMFCVVRNPWDRLYSAYQYLCSGGNNGSDKYLSNMINDECKNFQDFVLNWLDYDKIYNIKVLKPQFIYIYDFQNDIVVVKNIIRFENLKNEFSLIQEKLNISGELPWKNKSNNTDFVKYYTEDMVEAVSNFYAFDIKLFNYKFENINDT